LEPFLNSSLPENIITTGVNKWTLINCNTMIDNIFHL
jgi:hypothetical protein